MSSVSSKNDAEKANQDEYVRKMREEYKRREAELINKHNQELRQTSKKTVAEIDRIKSSHDMQMENMRQGTRDAITKRDAKYQREIADLKSLQNKQLSRLMRENDTKLKAERSASQAQVKHASRSKSDRVQELNQKYNESIAQEKANLEQQLNKARAEQSKALTQNREDFLEKHEADTTRLRDNYSDQIIDLRNDLRVTRSNANQRLKNQETRHMRDKYNLSTGFMDEVRRREESHNDIQDSSRRGFGNSLDEIRQENFLNEKSRSASYTDSLQDLKSDVTERMNEREKRLERQLTDVKAKNIREEDKLKKEYKENVKNITKEYHAKFEQLERGRQASLDAANRRIAEKVANMKSLNDEALGLNSKYYQGQLDQENLKSKTELDRLKNEYSLKTEYQQNNQASKISTMREKSIGDQKRLRENYSKNLDIMKQTHESEQRDTRLTLMKEKSEALNFMQNEFQKQEVEHQKKVADLQSSYEQKMASLNDRFLREKRLRDNREKYLVENLKRASDQEKEALKQQYAEKSQQANAQHEKEMREVTRRHKEQIDNIMSNIKKT